jgi:hypothetical protein
MGNPCDAVGLYEKILNYKIMMDLFYLKLNIDQRCIKKTTQKLKT